MPDACSCSNGRYTDHLFNIIFRHVDFSKEFMEKCYYTLYILSFITLFSVILIHLNTSGVKMKPSL
jgi:hypothetical protein